MKPYPGTDTVTSDRLAERMQAVVRRASQLTTVQAALLAFGFALLITLTYRPFSQMEVGDRAFYDYIAQSILRGQLPYRDTVDIKFPGGAYLSALAMAAGHLVGLRDLLAVRALYLLLAGLFSALIFLTAVHYLRSRAAGVIAVLIPLSLPRFNELTTTGTEPKLALMVCGLLTLLMIARDRPFWAGLSGMLACLFWQPGLMFVGTAVLIFSGYLTRWRDLRAVKVLCGAALPLGLVLLYFYSQGALGDLWAWTMTYNYSVFGPDARRGLFEALAHLWKIASRFFQASTVVLPLSVMGFALFAAARLKAKRRLRAALRDRELYRDALCWPPLVYFAFALVNFQAAPDLLPFMPFIALFAGWLFVEAGRWLTARGIASARWPRVEWRTWVPVGAVALLLLIALVSSATYRLPGWTLRGQESALQPVIAEIGPDDKIYVHGTAELLVFMNRANLNPYLFLDWGADEFAAYRRGVPFSQLIDEIEAQKPKVVSLTRLKAVRHRDDFLRWAEPRYTPLDINGYEGTYVRKP